MELRQLKYFLAVADSRSFVSAANNLFVSRQAISKAIAQLEEELKIELFMRNSNGAFLTPTGMMFYDRIRGVVMELDEITDEMRSLGNRYQQRIRIAFSIGTMPLYEQNLLQFKTSQVNVNIEYQECPEDRCIGLLTEHKADVAICTSPPQSELFACEECLRSRFGVLIQDQENLKNLDSVDFSDLSWLPIAGTDDRSNHELCNKHHLSLQYSGYDYYRLFQLVQAGRCALLLPECLIPAHWEGLRWLPIETKEWWCVYQVRAQSVEKNILYRTALDELQYQVFQKKEGE